MTPERDEATEKAPKVLIDSATYAADNTPAAVDMLNYRGATILLNIGVGGITFSGTNKVEFVLTHSDDGTTYTNVTETDIIQDANDTLQPALANGIIANLIAAHAAATTSKIGYIGGKRYLKLLADFSGTHGTGTPIGATLILEDGQFEGAV
jgi:hypothetical protein